jgi:hypothetical protein
MFTPAVVKVIKYLKDTGAKKTQEELATIIDEPLEYVNKALGKLIAINVVTQEEEGYLYHATPDSNQFAAQLMEVYEKVNRKPAKEMLIRGLICQIPPQYLFHIHTLLEILQQEGVEREEFDQFLVQETAKGYLKRIRVVYIGKEPSIVPIYIPPYYFYRLHHLGIIDHQKYASLKQESKDDEFQEEDYLIARYPPELANPAREYIERERGELRDNLRKRGLVSWGGGLWRLR